MSPWSLAGPSSGVRFRGGCPGSRFVKQVRPSWPPKKSQSVSQSVSLSVCLWKRPSVARALLDSSGRRPTK
eukprot:2895011-Pyramimonas_sp.AAC.1